MLRLLAARGISPKYLPDRQDVSLAVQTSTSQLSWEQPPRRAVPRTTGLLVPPGKTPEALWRTWLAGPTARPVGENLDV